MCLDGIVLFFKGSDKAFDGCSVRIRDNGMEHFLLIPAQVRYLSGIVRSGMGLLCKKEFCNSPSLVKFLSVEADAVIPPLFSLLMELLLTNNSSDSLVSVSTWPGPVQRIRLSI